MWRGGETKKNRKNTDDLYDWGKKKKKAEILLKEIHKFNRLKINNFCLW